MSDELLTQAQIAREFSLSKGTVSDYVKSGRLKSSGETKTGKPLFSREDAKKVSSLAHLNNRKINKASPSSKAHISKVTPDSSFDGQSDPVGEISLGVDSWLLSLLGKDFEQLGDAAKINRSRAIREARLAALADIDVRKAQGELIEKELVAQDARACGAAVTSLMHTWPARLTIHKMII
ncbi:hypothetical protein AB7W11_02575 [Providencia manganoxydans]|uniref:hypothetical protein n=1 Tax=Providencia manganoxydans TaxID=2923283 RepID=UPI0034E4D874